MTLQEIITRFPNQYIALVYTKKGIDNLIEEATVIKVYPTLESAYNSQSEIKAYKRRYSNFDIVYGDYNDYVNTRRKLAKDLVQSFNQAFLSQSDIDKLLEMIEDKSR